MKLRIPALLLSLCLLLTVPALAAPNSTGNFIRNKTYHNQFSDLRADSVFYDNVIALYEYDLSLGKPDGTFGLNDTLSVGQVVIFAARIRSLYCTGSAEAGSAPFRKDGQAVCIPYLMYLKEQNVLGQELDNRLFQPATRAEVAHVLSRTLPAKALPPVHEALVTAGYANRKFLPDVTEATPYYQDILTLCSCGISNGSDRAGTFLPGAFITRGAAAAMLTRMVDPDLRVAPVWYSVQGATLASLVPKGSLVSAPYQKKELEKCIQYMLSSDSSTLRLQFPALNAQDAQSIMSMALSIVKSYCEQSYNTVSCTYTENGAMTLTFGSSTANGNFLSSYRNEALKAAIKVHDRLWRTGKITPDMSDLQKARVYFDWICKNCTYDYRAKDNSSSHLPYGLFRNGKAVCDGYTGAYNLLLKLEDIPCTALSNDTHIWTVAQLDGRQLHIDTTWADTSEQINDAYFAMTAKKSWAVHSW